MALMNLLPLLSALDCNWNGPAPRILSFPHLQSARRRRSSGGRGREATDNHSHAPTSIHCQEGRGRRGRFRKKHEDIFFVTSRQWRKQQMCQLSMSLLGPDLWKGGKDYP